MTTSEDHPSCVLPLSGLAVLRPGQVRRHPSRGRPGRRAPRPRGGRRGDHPGFLRSEAVLDQFGVTEENWSAAGDRDAHFASSETPHYIGRAVAALAADPNKLERSGTATATWQLAKEYGFTDVDGTRPDRGQHVLQLGWSA